MRFAGQRLPRIKEVSLARHLVIILQFRSHTLISIACVLHFHGPLEASQHFRLLVAGYDVQLLGDVVAKAFTAALNKLCIGVNMLGNKHREHFDQQGDYDKFYDSWLMAELECHRTIKAPSRRGAGTVTQSAADIR